MCSSHDSCDCNTGLCGSSQESREDEPGESLGNPDKPICVPNRVRRTGKPSTRIGLAIFFLGEDMDAITSQNRKILSHLQKIGPITPLQALHLYGCNRLAARAHDLRLDGHRIITTMISIPARKSEAAKRVAQYSLVKPRGATE